MAVWLDLTWICGVEQNSSTNGRRIAPRRPRTAGLQEGKVDEVEQLSM